VGRPISHANIWAAAIQREKSGHHPWEDLTKSCYKTKYEVQIHLAKKKKKSKKIIIIN
jgi:hypothetical protein